MQHRFSPLYAECSIDFPHYTLNAAWIFWVVTYRTVSYLQSSCITGIIFPFLWPRCWAGCLWRCPLLLSTLTTGWAVITTSRMYRHSSSFMAPFCGAACKLCHRSNDSVQPCKKLYISAYSHGERIMSNHYSRFQCINYRSDKLSDEMSRAPKMLGV